MGIETAQEEQDSPSSARGGRTLSARSVGSLAGDPMIKVGFVGPWEAL